MKPMLVLRPEPGATATAERIAAMGGRAIVAPLFTIEPIDWTPPAGPFDALMLTSANAVRAAGAGLGRYRLLPAYAVGASTAAAMREAGIDPVALGEGDAADLLASLAADGRSAVLHLTGEEFRQVADPRVSITHVPVYRAVVLAALPAEAKGAIGEGVVALLHSPRAARTFAELLDRAGLSRKDVALAAISPAAAQAAGPGWRTVAVAARPTDQALLAAAARLCEG